MCISSVNPKERLAATIKELNDLQLNANRSLAPAERKISRSWQVFLQTGRIGEKASEYNARLNANLPLNSSDWDSLKLDELRKTVQDLDYNHPIRNFVEQRLLSNVETRLNGMGKRVVRDPYNPFPKIPRSENFPDEFVYVGGLPNSFGDGPETSELQYCLFTCPGSIYAKGNSALTFKASPLDQGR